MFGPASHESPPGKAVKLVDQLKCCNSLVEVRKVMKSSGVKIEQKAACSRLGFSRLLDASVPLQSLLEFLNDASLNAPEAQNLQRLLDHIAKRAPNEQDLGVLSTWMRRHVSLGRIPEADIASVLNSGCHIKSGVCHHDLGPLIAMSIWDGLQSSSVLRPKDLNIKAVRTLLEHISRNKWSSRIQSIGNSIVRLSSRSQLYNLRSGIAAFMRSWLFATKIHTGIQRLELPELENRTAIAQFLDILPTNVASATLEMVITDELMENPVMSRETQDSLARIVRLLEILPAQISNSSVASATSNICLKHRQGRRKGRGGLELLKPWLQILSKSEAFWHSISYGAEWRTFEKILSDRKMEALYLRELSDRERCRFILRHWILEDSGKQNVGKAPTAASNILACFEGLNQAEHGTAPYGHMLRALRHHTKSFDIILPRLFSLLFSLGGTQMTVNVIRRMQRYGLPIDARTMSFVIRGYCEKQPASALSLFESHTGLSLEKCPELAESLIADPETGPDTVFRHLGLARHTKAVLNEESAYQDGRVFSKARVRLIHRMALAFANAAHLQPRIALRYVYRCYTILNRGGGRLFDPQLSRALTVAGIIRPLKAGQWVSTMKLRWILALVKDIEGEETARELDETVYEWRGQVVRDIQAEQWRRRAFGHPNEPFEPESIRQCLVEN